VGSDEQILANPVEVQDRQQFVEVGCRLFWNVRLAVRVEAGRHRLSFGALQIVLPDPVDMDQVG
jgi:hypothetical protein